MKVWEAGEREVVCLSLTSWHSIENRGTVGQHWSNIVGNWGLNAVAVVAAAGRKTPKSLHPVAENT